MTACGVFVGEVVLDGGGNYIGDFGSTYLQPNAEPGFDLWPIGFTKSSWFQISNAATPTPVAGPYADGDPIDPAEDTSDFPVDYMTCPADPPGPDPGLFPRPDQSFINPSSQMRVVSDSSGPSGVESAPALEITFSGLAAEGATFIGEDGGFGSPRSTTGWTVNAGECWTCQFWVKPVSDDSGFVCTGYDFGAVSATIFPSSFGDITLVADWQLYKKSLTYGVGHTNTQLLLRTGHQNRIGGRGFRKGRVHIKCLHVYPCDAARANRAHAFLTSTRQSRWPVSAG